jgi:hypothetical protein
VSRDEAATAAIAMLGVIMKMSDHAESLGGARSIPGVAALNTMQVSLQKNGPRMAILAKTILETVGVVS